MAQAYEIALESTAQKFSVVLGDVKYQMSLYWCEPGAHWTLDISTVDAVPIVRGIPLVPYLDLFEQYEHLGFKGRLVVQGLSDANAPPTLESLGTDGLLFWIPDA